jgi:hypothetical protein
MLSEGQELAIEVGAAVLGTAQPFLLRQYVDTSFGTLYAPAGAYATPSALAGFIAGGGALAAGIIGAVWGKGVKDPFIQKALVAYGAPCLTASTIIAFLTPMVSTASTSTSTSTSTSAQGVFAPNKATTAPAASMSAAERNMASLTPQQRLLKGVY